jgi:hypothetical protein
MFGKELGGDKYDCSKADGEHRAMNNSVVGFINWFSTI